MPCWCEFTRALDIPWLHVVKVSAPVECRDEVVAVMKVSAPFECGKEARATSKAKRHLFFWLRKDGRNILLFRTPSAMSEFVSAGEMVPAPVVENGGSGDVIALRSTLPFHGRVEQRSKR